MQYQNKLSQKNSCPQGWDSRGRMSLSEWVLIMITVLKRITVRIYIYIYVFFFFFKFQLHTYLSKYTEIFNQESERSVAKRRSISNSVCLSVKTLHEHSVLYTIHILDSNLWPWFLQFLNTYSLHCQVYASCKSFD